MPVIAGPPLDINVELTVTTGPQMVVNPLILTGAVMMGQNLTNQTLQISNVSTTEQIGYGVTTNQSWLTITQTNYTLNPQTTNELTVSYPTSGLTTNSAGGPSNYNATITVTATNPTDAVGSPAAVAVSLTVNPKSRLNLSTTLLTNIVTEGYDAPDCTFEIWNGNGYYTLSYTISDNADWFTLTPATVTSTGAHDVITAEFSTAGFTAGVSNALITVVGRAYDGTHFDSALDATQTVAILLTVTPAVEMATDALSTYEISARFGRPAGSTHFQVWNASAGESVLQWTIATNASWLAGRPASGTSAGESNTIILACNADNLRPGKYAGALTISGIDQATGTEARNSPANINVELTIFAEKGFDFSGDGAGASDLIVYQESSGLWNITNLFSGYTTNVIFGGKGYAPVPGDFDSDAITDLGAYRYSSGYWYVRRISDQQLAVCGGSYWAGPELASLGGYVSVAGD
ncbi:MAG: hypothetical protein Q8O57_02440, partial [Kiritimatiellota bacterium]|nr:hypothetical protein [Kiritimatiellota bacterium]